MSLTANDQYKDWLCVRAEEHYQFGEKMYSAAKWVYTKFPAMETEVVAMGNEDIESKSHLTIDRLNTEAMKQSAKDAILDEITRGMNA